MGATRGFQVAGLIACLIQAPSTRFTELSPPRWVYIGYAVRVPGHRAPAPLRSQTSSFLRCSVSKLAIHVFAHRGHVWGCCAELKQISRRFHVEVALMPWPPGSRGGSSVWREGRIDRWFGPPDR
jgi:hypothetical protein